MPTRTPRSILVAADLSEGSSDVLRTGAALASLAGGELHVLHAFDLQDMPYLEHEQISISFQARLADAERALDDWIRGGIPAGTPVASRKVVIRTAYKAILERAVDVDADLIVLGPHRGRGAVDRVLGSTADRVVRTSKVPCLVVPGPLSLPLRRLVVPLDLSSHARGALDVALAWALDYGRDSRYGLPDVEVDVVHVVPTLLAGREIGFDRAIVSPDLHREVREALERTPDAADVELRVEVLWHDAPAEEIVRFSAESLADMIVMGTHGYGALKRALLGSVASGVVRRAACPVLLVPPALWRARREEAEERSGELTEVV